MRYKIEQEAKDSGILMKWLWRFYLKKHVLLICFAFVFMTLQGSMLGVLSYLIGPMFDEVFLNANYAALYFLGIGVLLCLRFAGRRDSSKGWVMTSVGERVKLELQRDLMRHVLTLDTMFFEANPPGNLMERVIGDAGTIRSVWSGLLAPAISGCYFVNFPTDCFDVD